jgi:hypothetical protein
MNSTTFVLFDKYYPIVDQLDSKDSSRDFQLNCVINTPYKRLKIDVMEREWKNLEFGWHLTKPQIASRLPVRREYFLLLSSTRAVFSYKNFCKMTL